MYKAFPAVTGAYRPRYRSNEQKYYASGKSVRVETTISGPLFLHPTESLKAGVSTAIGKTAEAGKGWVQADSPVDTGLLKSRWYTKAVSWDKWRLSNDIYYTPFNERRVRMLERNLPRISKELVRQLNTEIPKALNG